VFIICQIVEKRGKVEWEKGDVAWLAVLALCEEAKKIFELKGEFAVSKQLISKQIKHHPREVSLFTG
jgi:hypothetical protein